MLKIAGVKSEAAFYKKFPTQEAFMKVHGKEFKKAQIGAYIGGDANPMAEFIDFNDAYNYSDKQATGSTASERNKESYNQQMLEALKSKGGGGDKSSGAGGEDIMNTMDMMTPEELEAGEGSEGGGIMDMIGGEGGGGAEGGGGFMEMLGGLFGGGAKYGTTIPKAYSGTNVNNWWSNITTTAQSTYPPNVSQTYGIGAQTMGQMKSPPVPQTNPVPQGDPNGPGGIMGKNTSGPPYATGNVTQSNLPLGYDPGKGSDNNLSSKLGNATKLLGPIGGIIEGVDALKAEKEQAARAKQMRMLTDLQLKASTTRPEEKERRYVRPEDIVNTGESFFPIYGVGTNVLARDGRFIKKAQDGTIETPQIDSAPTEIQNTYGNHRSIYDDLGYVPLIDEDQDKNFRYGGDIPQAQTGWDNYMNTMSGGGSGFSGAGAAASGGTPWGQIGGFVSNAEQSFGTGPNAGGNIGGNVGQSIGAAFGPIGMAAGQVVGTIAGKLLDPYPGAIKVDTAKTKKNVEGVAYNAMAPAIQAPYEAHVRDGGNIPNYEYGGYMNPEYNPQVIARFGELDAQDFAKFAHKDQYRAGGHLRQYRNPSEEAMQTYKDGGEVRRSALNGEVQTTWGGGVRTLSHNPYMPGTGETIEFVGNSHDKYDPRSKQTGIGVKYGQGNQDSYTDYAEYGTEQADANVEVEKEPAAELIDPKTGEKNLTVYGNLKIPNQFVSLLGDDKAKGKKFKHYVSNLSKQEEKQNRIIATSTNSLNDLDVKNSFDRLKLSSLEASINGANMKLKTLADRKTKAADIQNAINDTAEEYGIVADDLARGKFKIDKEAMQEFARDGKSIPKAQNGLTFKDEKEANDKGYYWTGKFLSNGSKEYKTRTTKTTKKTETSENAKALGEIPKNQKKDSTTGLFNVTPDQLEAFKKKHAWYPDWDKFDPKKPETVDNFAKAFNTRAKKIGSTAEIKPDDKATGKTKYVGDQFLSADFGEEKKETPEKEEDLYAEVPVDKKEDPQYEVEGYKRNKLADLFNQILPFIRPSDQEAFDYAQLYPEMNALATNQLEPVQAQGFQPDLATPYDISYQDQLNANQADYNSMQKMVGYNPAAQGILNAQKYAANEKVLGEQFRANQAMQAGVYDANRQTLNNAKLKNLDIFDRQYVRQAEALSNTKATTQAALNSISDKIAKNKLENKTLGIYENLYNYRYDNKGRAINMNPLFQSNMPYVYGPDGKPTHKIVRDSKGNVIDLVPIVKEEVAKKQNAVIPSQSSGPIVPQGSVAPTEYVPIDEEEYTNEEYMNQVAPKKNGGKVKNKYVQSSIVRGFK